MLYVVALVLFPSWAGVSALGIVVTPARALLALLIPVGLYSTLTPHGRRPSVLILAWTVFLIAALVTTALHLDDRSLARFLSFVVEGALLFWVATELMADDRVRQRVLVALALTTIGAALVAMALALAGTQYNDGFARILGHEIVPLGARVRFGVVRLEGPMGQPLVFAAWLVTALPLCISLVQPGVRLVRRNLIPLSGAVALTLALIFTVSRSAMILASFVPAAFAWGLGRMRVAIALAAVGLAMSIVVTVSSGTVSLPTAPPTASTPSSSASSTAGKNAVQRSGEQRLAAYRAALTTVMEQPLFGHGLLRGSDALSAVAGRTNYVDNTYLQVAVEQGLIGLAALAGLLAVVLRLAYDRRRTRLGLGVLAALCAFLLMGVVASLFSFTQVFALFWVLAAAATAPALPVGATHPGAGSRLG